MCVCVGGGGGGGKRGGFGRDGLKGEQGLTHQQAGEKHGGRGDGGGDIGCGEYGYGVEFQGPRGWGERDRGSRAHLQQGLVGHDRGAWLALLARHLHQGHLLHSHALHCIYTFWFVQMTYLLPTRSMPAFEEC